jgi:mono/diheme cytochrome c family protein
MTRTLIGSAILALVVGVACAAPAGLQSGAGGSGAGGSTGTGTIGADSGLPCEISAILTDHCLVCHGTTPMGGAVGTMLTYAELAAPSQEQASTSVAALALSKMKSTTAPMPPKGSPALTAAEIASWEAWVDGGLKPGTCGGIDGGPPDTTFDGTSTCLGTKLALTCHESVDMNPGMPCIGCHTNPSKYGCGDTGPFLAIAGTVFALGHVPDDCRPTTAQAADLTQAQVIITDANGVEHPLKPTKVGNFSSTKNGPKLATPYTARVVYMGKTRVMASSQTSGDCNACHTDKGTTTVPGGPVAPGRIALPVYP